MKKYSYKKSSDGIDFILSLLNFEQTVLNRKKDLKISFRQKYNKNKTITQIHNNVTATKFHQGT